MYLNFIKVIKIKTGLFNERNDDIKKETRVYRIS